MKLDYTPTQESRKRLLAQDSFGAARTPRRPNALLRPEPESDPVRVGRIHWRRENGALGLADLWDIATA